MMRFFLFLILLTNTVSAKTLPATNFQITHDFINNMVEKHQFNRDELLFIFSQIELKLGQKNAKTRQKKPTKKPLSWAQYQRLFITNARIKNGIEFWHTHQKTLERAEKKYRIPVEIIVAILGIETNYGKKKGDHPTLQTLTRLAFGNHVRKKFYKKELQAFLLMTRENAMPPLAIEGSYAGAMGYAQFIASSYRYYAVDFNEDGKIDLFSDPIDSIGSIGNYFAKHYWQPNGEFARIVTLDSKAQKYALRTTNKPKKSAKYWREKGVKIDNNIHHKTKLAFIKLPQQTTHETWLTFWNFYVLTRYNHDNRYAMVAYQLSQKLKSKFYEKK